MKTTKTRSIDKFDLNRKFINTYGSMKDAVSKTGIDYSSISLCCTGRRNKAKGFIFTYNNSHIIENEFDAHFNNLPQNIKDISYRVRMYFNIDNKTLFENKKKLKNFIPRHILAYLIKINIQNVTLNDISKWIRIDKMHHSNVINCIKKAKTELKYNDKLRDEFSPKEDINLGIEINTLNELNKYKKLGYRIITAN